MQLFSWQREVLGVAHHIVDCFDVLGALDDASDGASTHQPWRLDKYYQIIKPLGVDVIVCRQAGPAAGTGGGGDLLSVLQRVAPQQPGRPREVLIAISNYNLVLSGQLPLWLQVPP